VHGEVPLTQNGYYKMVCYSGYVKVALHFYLPSAYDILLQIRAYGFFRLVEYPTQTNLILNQDPT
jgi:hypothetical protein